MSLSTPRRVTTVLVSGALVFGLPLMSTSSADAAAKEYKNCTAMHADYKGGVARKGAHDKRTSGGHAKYKPYVSNALYNANKKSDRDNDGIACEA